MKHQVNKLQQQIATLFPDFQAKAAGSEKRAKSSKKHPALMTHVVLGYPSIKESIDIVCAMADGGASFIELQIPFSDPMADGSTIMMANEHALQGGVTPTDCIKAMEHLSRKVSVPLLFMSYLNLLFAYRGQGKKSGLEQFCSDASSAGAQGLIVPDIPPEENDEGYWSLSRKYGLAPIALVSPLTNSTRMKLIAKNASAGFVYCVSTTGTTGARASLPPGLADYTARVRKHFSLPRALGFGISSPAQVKALAGHAEIAVVGSAMIDLIQRSKKSERIKVVRRFTSSLVAD